MCKMVDIDRNECASSQIRSETSFSKRTEDGLSGVCVFAWYSREDYYAIKVKRRNDKSIEDNILPLMS